MYEIIIPEKVRNILKRFEERGYSAYAVGGCLRDSLLGKQPNDWDIAVSCQPDETMKLFEGFAVPTGLRHGTVTIKCDGELYEITTFRKDGVYRDHRRPESVSFVDSIEADLARRDFTVNAMAADIDGKIIDPFGGKQDIEEKLIRCVGDAKTRFQEDSLRIFRAYRFSAQLGFGIEKDTLTAIHDCAHLAVCPAAERVRAELDKMLIHNCGQQLSEMFTIGMYARFCGKISEIDFSGINLIEPDRIKRLCAVCALLEKAKIADTVVFLDSLRYERNTVKLCHMGVKAALERSPASRSDWRHLVADFGSAAAECAAAARTALGDSDAYSLLQSAVLFGGCLNVKGLAVNGDDLKALGFRGESIGNTLNVLLHRVVDDPGINKKSVLLKIAEDYV